MGMRVYLKMRDIHFFVSKVQTMLMGFCFFLGVPNVETYNDIFSY